MILFIYANEEAKVRHIHQLSPDAYDTANLIAVKLRHAGYKVFFDVDTLIAGKFNEQL